MKTKHPSFEMLDYGVTPDYSLRVPNMVLSARVREDGRQLSQFRLIRTPWKSNSVSYEQLASPVDIEAKQENLVQLHVTEVERGKIEYIEIDDADLVLIDDIDWGEIPPKASFPVQLRITKVERGQIEPIEIDDADLIFFDF